MRFDILTLFPEIFSSFLRESLLHKAIDRKLVSVATHNIRDWATNKHQTVDDRPFGGGPGMVLKAEPVVESVEAVQQLAEPSGTLIMLTPQGRRLDQPLVEQLATQERLLLLCGRYEGFDERIRLLLKPMEVSIGDYVLNGGEVAAMVLIEALIRLIPGVLGDEESSQRDSFSGADRWLEHEQYTRPRVFRGLEVPEVLLSGDHPRIARWREERSRQRTQTRRTLDDESGAAQDSS